MPTVPDMTTRRGIFSGERTRLACSSRRLAAMRTITSVGSASSAITAGVLALAQGTSFGTGTQVRNFFAKSGG
jgi:hypothetical protein